MRKIGSTNTDTEEDVDAALRQLPSIGEQLRECEMITTPVASPIRRAVDAQGIHARSKSGDEWFIKYYYPENRHRFDLNAIADASEKAGRLGVAPAVVDRSVENGVIAFEWLGSGWTWGRLDWLSTDAARDAQFELRKRIHASQPFSRDRNIFSEIDTLVENVRTADVSLPSDLDWMLSEVHIAAEKLESSCPGRVPAHGDGASSNVMVHDSGELRLIDFDAAGNNDPAHDLASMLVEICPLKENVAASVERWSGAPDPVLFAKCMLYGVADDLCWGLWGLERFANSELPGVEYFKYAQWRLLRARYNLQDRDFDAWCRAL